MSVALAVGSLLVGCVLSYMVASLQRNKDNSIFLVGVDTRRLVVGTASILSLIVCIYVLVAIIVFTVKGQLTLDRVSGAAIILMVVAACFVWLPVLSHLYGLQRANDKQKKEAVNHVI